MKIRILALYGCSKCESAKNKFKQSGIVYEATHCEDNPSNCDCVESIVETKMYPIIVLEKNGEMLEILYLTDAMTTLLEGKKQVSGIVTIPSYSIDNMVYYIKNRLNL